MSDAIPESDVLEERSIEVLGRETRGRSEGVSEADVVDELHQADAPGSAGLLLPRLREDVSEADAIDQAWPVGYDDEDDWR